MKQLLIVIPFPMRTIELNEYMRTYLAKYAAMGYDCKREKVYFWEHKVLHSFKWLLLVRYLFRPLQACVIHQHTIPSSGPMVVLFLFCARLLQRRTIVVSHETVETYAKHLPAALRWIAYLYEWMVVGLSSRYVVHTRLHFRELAAFAPVRRMEIIPLPLPDVKICPVPTAKTTWGFYGMLAYKKGVELLIKAYQNQPVAALPPLRIMGAAAPGEAAYENECRQMVRPEFGELIRFTGFVPEKDKPSLFADLALMIFPYRYISQSAALSESCLYEIPYLLSDVPSFAEYYETFGCGRVFESESVASLQAELLRWAIEPLLVAPEKWQAMRDALSVDKCTTRFRMLFEGTPGDGAPESVANAV